MKNIQIEVYEEEGQFGIRVLKGRIPCFETPIIGTYPEVEFLADFDGCYTPSDALRVFADALDRSFARSAWDAIEDGDEDKEED